MELFVLKRRAAALAAALLAALPACRERIHIDVSASAPRLVIYGYITTDTMRHNIRISRSAGYFSSDKPEGLSGARVSIRHKEEIYPLTEAAAEAGLYQTDANVAGLEGETYTLHVALDFNQDGQAEEYEATSYLPPALRLDSMAVQPSLFSGQFLEILIWGRLPEQDENYFSIHLYRNNVAVNDSLRGFTISNDQYLNRKDIAGLTVFFLNQEREASKLLSGDRISCQAEGVTPEYAAFILNAQAENRGSIPMFSAPPANVETNIRSLGPESDVRLSGFFTAFSKSRISITCP